MPPHSSKSVMPDTDLGVPGPSKSQNTVDHPHVLSGTRVVETLQLYPPYVIPLAALTAAFLVVELAFAAHLLDAVGGPISERQLTELAVWGWALSGGALSLPALVPLQWRHSGVAG